MRSEFNVRALRGLVAAALTIAAAAAMSAPATAGTASFSISPTAVEPGSGASVLWGKILLPGDQMIRFTFGFVLPRDYKRDTPFTVIVNMNTYEPPCTINMSFNQLDRARKGKNPVIASGGASIKNGGLIAVSKIKAFTAEYTVKPGNGFKVQKPGDSLLFNLFPLGDDVTDTCNLVYVWGIDVIYTTK